MIEFEIDDGVGLPDGWDLEEAAGIGLANTMARLKQLYGERHRFEIGPAEGVGTVVRVSIPLHFDAINGGEGGDSRTDRRR